MADQTRQGCEVWEGLCCDGGLVMVMCAIGPTGSRDWSGLMSGLEGSIQAGIYPVSHSHASSTNIEFD